MANNLWNWPSTCGTGQQPVEVVNILWNWPTTCGTGQQPVELANNKPVELANKVWNWPNLMELINIKQPWITVTFWSFLCAGDAGGRPSPGGQTRTSWRRSSSSWACSPRWTIFFEHTSKQWKIKTLLLGQPVCAEVDTGKGWGLAWSRSRHVWILKISNFFYVS